MLIPRTDFDAFPITLGANTFGWTADEDRSLEIMDAYVRAGGNVIDTADMYSSWAPGNIGGESERIIGTWLETRPEYADKVLVATKSGALDGVEGRTREKTEAAVDASLQRLGVSCIDLFYYHHDDDTVAIEEQVDIANGLIEFGKIKHLALSNYDPARLQAFCERAAGTPAAPVAIQPHYNLLHRREFEQNYRHLAEEYEMAVFSYFSLASGLLSAKYRSAAEISGARAAMIDAYLEETTFDVLAALRNVAGRHGITPTTAALAWLKHKGVTSPIASVSKVEQLDALIALERISISEADMAELDEASRAFA